MATGTLRFIRAEPALWGVVHILLLVAYLILLFD